MVGCCNTVSKRGLFLNSTQDAGVRKELTIHLYLSKVFFLLSFFFPTSFNIDEKIYAFCRPIELNFVFSIDLTSINLHVVVNCNLGKE